MMPIEALPPPQSCRGFFFLSSVYTQWRDGFDDAALIAGDAAGRLMARGYVIFSPIAHGHFIEDASGLTLSHSEWMGQCRPFVVGSIGLIVLMMEGWERSEGITIERKTAQSLGLPIYGMHHPFT